MEKIVIMDCSEESVNIHTLKPQYANLSTDMLLSELGYNPNFCSVMWCGSKVHVNICE